MSALSSIARFAPSPTGPLHFGSLVSALASYLDIKKRQGQWLVRIEDVDPPREVPGASATILQQLEAHGLHWDGDVLYQSERLPDYMAALDQLRQKDLTYFCQCNRQRMQSLGGIYDSHCRYFCSCHALPEQLTGLEPSGLLPPPLPRRRSRARSRARGRRRRGG